jgi:DNA gyrase subunit A
MEIGTVRQVDIEQEMKGAYLDYAMSVITARALPDVRDGLKPVQRRILYAMNDMGLQHDKPYKKSARIVGEVLGKYHPHGDVAVYEAMCRMAQDFTMRYMLVDGQGNFGSVDGDNPAAMRYTEARLAAIASEMLADIDKDTVDFTDNFDGTLREPQVLPARLPNLLLNGASGIAVGMATNIPPHNLSEICDAMAYLIDNYSKLGSVSVDDLIKFIKGPDFPTGGTILGLEGIRSAYATGGGYIAVRAKAHFEEAGGGKSLIIITELPYQVAKAGLIEKIAELVRDKRIDTISDLRDESDRQGMRIVIEMKRGIEPRPTLMQLYKLTPMQSTFNVNMLALVDGEPRVLSLKKILQLFIEHRQEVITRRSQFELQRAKLRAHILEGLKIALDHLDAVIATIRKSQTADTALQNLMKQFKLTEVQARAILDLQLRRLAALERRRIEEEYQETLKYIKYLEGLLASPKKILSLIRGEMEDLKARYGDNRKTRISEKEAEEISVDDLQPEEDVLIAVTQRGYVRRLPARSDRLWSATGKGDAIQHVVPSNTLHHILFCTNKGRCFTLKAHQIPDGAQQTGVPLSNLLSIEADEVVTAVVNVPEFKEHFPLTICTAQGRIKRVSVQEFSGVRTSGLIAITLDDGDELRWVKLTSGGQELILVTASGQALRFKEDEVRVMGRSAAGVSAIKLASGDRLIGMDVAEEGAALLVASEKGYAKRTPLDTYPTQSRYGKGVATFAKISPQTGCLAAACAVCEDDEVAFLTASGAALQIKASRIAQQGRSTRGTALVALKGSDTVTGIVRIAARPKAPSPQAKGKVLSEARGQVLSEARGKESKEKAATAHKKTAAIRRTAELTTEAKKPATRAKKRQSAQSQAMGRASATRKKPGTS